MADFTREQQDFLRSLEDDAMDEGRRNIKGRVIRRGKPPKPPHAGGGASLTLFASQNPITIGSSVTFTATLRLQGNPTGTVSFFDGINQIGSNQTLTGSPPTASLATSALTAGSHAITARYNGDASHGVVTSAALGIGVNLLATSVALGSSPNPSASGQSVTLTATITGGGTGTVTFLDGGTSLGTGSISGATATLSTSALTAGPHSLSASYGGDATHAASGSPVLSHSVTSASVLQLNIKDAPFNAVGDGIADDAPAFVAFRDYAIANQGSMQVILTIPGGTYLFNSNVSPDTFLFSHRTNGSIKNLKVMGAGATLKRGPNNNAFYFGCVPHQWEDTGAVAAHRGARLQNVAAGATTVTLKTAGETSRFAVNDWALLCGLDTQGLWQLSYGFPLNNHFFEFVQVQSIGSGTVTLTAPTKNAYKSTWPDMQTQTFGTDNCGAATLMPISQHWNIVHEYIGMTIDKQSPGQAMRAEGRDITWRNCAVLGSGDSQGPIFPSFSKSVKYIGCTWLSGTMEADKIVESILFDDCDINTIAFQSSSIDLMTIQNNCTFGAIVGTPKKTVMSNSTIGFFIPPAFVHGRIDEITATNCVINQVCGDPYHDPTDNRVEGPDNVGVNFAWTITDGVIAIPNSDPTFFNHARWAVPGTFCVIGDRGHHFASIPFQVTDVTQDADFRYVHTTLTYDAWPVVQNSGGGPPNPDPGKYHIRCHPCPKLTFTSCTGTDGIAAMLSLAAAQGRPLYSYSKRSWTGSIRQAHYPIFGTFVKLVVDVTKAYSGINPCTVSPIGFFHLDPTTLQETTWNPVINLKQLGTRTVLLGQAPTGVQSGDTLLQVNSLYLSGSGAMTMTDVTGEDPATWPAFTIEIISDHGIP